MVLTPTNIKFPKKGCTSKNYQKFMRLRHQLNDMYWKDHPNGKEDYEKDVSKAKKIVPQIQRIINIGRKNKCDIYCPIMINDAKILKNLKNKCDLLINQKQVNNCYSNLFAMKNALADPNRHISAFCLGNKHEDVLPQLDKWFRDPQEKLNPPKITYLDN